jgi:hypothetical protein
MTSPSSSTLTPKAELAGMLAVILFFCAVALLTIMSGSIDRADRDRPTKGELSKAIAQSLTTEVLPYPISEGREEINVEAVDITNISRAFDNRQWIGDFPAKERIGNSYAWLITANVALTSHVKDAEGQLLPGKSYVGPLYYSVYRSELRDFRKKGGDLTVHSANDETSTVRVALSDRATDYHLPPVVLNRVVVFWGLASGVFLGLLLPAALNVAPASGLRGQDFLLTLILGWVGATLGGLAAGAACSVLEMVQASADSEQFIVWNLLDIAWRAVLLAGPAGAVATALVTLFGAGVGVTLRALLRHGAPRAPVPAIRPPK